MHNNVFCIDCRKGSVVADFDVNVHLFRADSNPKLIGKELENQTINLSRNGSLGDVPLTNGYIKNITVGILKKGMYQA